MENVWSYLRQNMLCARVWDSYDDILNACKAAWNWFVQDNAVSPQSENEIGRGSVVKQAI
jgi:hypothetical protein